MELDSDDDEPVAAGDTPIISNTDTQGDTSQSVPDVVDLAADVKSASTADNTFVDQSDTVQSPNTNIDQSQDDSVSAVDQPQPVSLVIGSLSDLKVMARDELPSEDALTAGIQALINKTQESSAMLDQVIRQKKV